MANNIPTILNVGRFTQEQYLAEAEKIITEKKSLRQNSGRPGEEPSLEERIYVRPEEFAIFIGAGVKEIGTCSFWTEHQGKAYEYELKYGGQVFTTRTFLPYIFLL